MNRINQFLIIRKF